MSYDRIWLECKEHPGGWHERTEFEERGGIKAFEADFIRLYAQGHFVVLAAGNNYMFDQLILCSSARAAQEVFDGGFHVWESFPEGEANGCGFQKIALFIDGQRVSTKSSDGSPSEGVCHE